MNWGHKIFLSFFGFVVFLGILVYRCFQTEVNLVAPDYYKQELIFQEQIEKIENERALVESATILHDAKLNALLINFPVKSKVRSAEVVLYRPSDANMDVSWELTGENYHELSTSHLAGGLWKVKLVWEDQAAKSYYKEQNVYFP